MRALAGVVLLLVLLAAVPAGAHEGPPFAIAVDRMAGPYKVSIWADPDVGTGTFWVTLEESAPADLAVDLYVQPADGRIPEARYSGKRENRPGAVQYLVQTQFDTEELWTTRFVLRAASGTGELRTQVSVTPPGFGRWDLLLYAAPFLAVGFLWIKAMLRKRRHAG